MPDALTPEEEPSSLVVRNATRVFLKVEHSVYVALGALLAVIAVLALIHSAVDVWRQTIDWSDPDRILDIMDGLLFILMLVEILHTVRVSIRSGSLTCEPFLIVGLIASIRRVLVITLESSKATAGADWTPEREQIFQNSMLELGVLAVLIIVMVVSIYIIRRAAAVNNKPDTVRS